MGPIHGDYLTFPTGRYIHALHLHRVHSVLRLLDFDAPPESPFPLFETLLLRGLHLPLVSLCALEEWKEAYGRKPLQCVVLVRVGEPKENLHLGLLSNGVPHIRHLTPESLIPLEERRLQILNLFRVDLKTPRGARAAATIDAQVASIRRAPITVVKTPGAELTQTS